MKMRFPKEYLFVFLLIFITILMVELQFIVGKLNTPEGTMYMGTVHWAPDYFYYLSQMTQGRENFLQSTILYTSEKLEPVFVGWQTVITGKIFLTLGFDVITAYQVAVVIYLILFLLLSYKVIAELFPDSARKRLLAFFFFLFSTAFFDLKNTPNGFELGFFTFWYNLGNALSRFGPTPHHLLANTFATVGILAVLKWLGGSKRRKELSIILIVVGVVLASITPVHWGLLVIATGLATSILLYHDVMVAFSKKVIPIKKIKAMVAPVFFLSLFGVLAALYAKRVFSTEPYSYAQIWEATQQVHVNLLWLIRGSGILIVLALFGLIPIVRKLNPGRIFGLCFVMACSIFYFTPIPEKLGMTNARFWPSTVYIFLAASSVLGVDFISSLWPKRRRIIFVSVMAIFIASLIPTYFAQYREVLKPQLGNAFYYLPLDAVDVYNQAEKVSEKNDVFLVQWPFNETFPALTGRKSFFGFYLLTIDSAEKERLAFQFFEGKLDSVEVWKFFARYNISYVIGYPWTPKINEFPFLTKIYENRMLGLYKVMR